MKHHGMNWDEMIADIKAEHGSVKEYVRKSNVEFRKMVGMYPEVYLHAFDSLEDLYRYVEGVGA